MPCILVKRSIFSHADASLGRTELRTDPSSSIHKDQKKEGSTGAEDRKNVDLAAIDAENLAESDTEKVDAGILAGDGAIKADASERNLHVVERNLYGCEGYSCGKSSKSKNSYSFSKSSKCSKGSKNSKSKGSKSKSGYGYKGCGYTG